MAARNKLQRGPTWLEVGVGAVLAVVLGVVLGALYLVTRPVTKVKEIPKDAPSGAVYFIEGARQFNNATADEKRKQLVAGSSIALDEGELNAFFNTATKGAKPDPDAMLTLSNLNARIKGGRLQLADTVSYNIFGFMGDIIVQANGTIARHGDHFEYDPETLLVGGCPLQRLPFVRAWALKRFLLASAPPDDVAGAWAKLSDVSIEGSLLRLKMP